MRFKEMALLADAVFMGRVRDSDRKAIRREMLRDIAGTVGYSIDEKIQLIGLLYGEDFKDEV